MRTSTLGQAQISLLPSCWPNLVVLELRNINQTYRLHTLGCLGALASLSVSGVKDKPAITVGILVSFLGFEFLKLNLSTNSN